MNNYPKHVYIRLIKYANLALGLAAVVFLGSILIAYPYSEYFQLPAQITAHILIMVLAGVIKVAFVARMVAQKGINESCVV
ncbi:MAG: hypothetical protein HRU22_15355 [Gammaproteobacteria bacterium]|nr:hypothetical protein [Gammaproteobacteria bacterium]